MGESIGIEAVSEIATAMSEILMEEMKETMQRKRQQREELYKQCIAEDTSGTLAEWQTVFAKFARIAPKPDEAGLLAFATSAGIVRNAVLEWQVKHNRPKPCSMQMLYKELTLLSQDLFARMMVFRANKNFDVSSRLEREQFDVDVVIMHLRRIMDVIPETFFSGFIVKNDKLGLMREIANLDLLSKLKDANDYFVVYLKQ